jgi:hypothetical protein
VRRWVAETEVTQVEISRKKVVDLNADLNRLPLPAAKKQRKREIERSLKTE